MRKYNWKKYRKTKLKVITSRHIRSESIEGSEPLSFLSGEGIRVQSHDITVDSHLRDLNYEVSQLNNLSEDVTRLNILNEDMNAPVYGVNIPFYNGIARRDAIESLVEGAMNIHCIGETETYNHLNPMANVIRSVIQGMRNNGEI